MGNKVFQMSNLHRHFRHLALKAANLFLNSVNPWLTEVETIILQVSQSSTQFDILK